MSIPTGVLLVLAALYAVKHKGADIPGMILGLAVGVNGAGGWIGQIVTQLTTAAIDVVTQVVNSLPIK